MSWKLKKTSWKNISVVVGLDFGTTYSGFTYCHCQDNNKNDKNQYQDKIFTNNKWPGEVNLKTNTVLQYDYDNEVKLWGRLALAEQPNRWDTNEAKPVELFKLHLGNLQENLKPKLPIDYKKAITDYLRELRKLIKERVETLPEINFFEDVLLVLTIPAEYTEKDQVIMKKCAYEAGLIGEDSQNLRFTTEPEAAAIYCMEHNLQEYDLLNKGTTFMIVDCGGGTVDLTTRKLVGSKQLGEVTERIGDFCGSTFIDREFVQFLRGKLGTDAIDELMENHYGQYQYMIQEFTRRVKIPFTGDYAEFFYELDVEENAPTLLEYVNEQTRKIMEYNDWLIEINYNDVKKMFDPIIDRIICMMHVQLSNNRENNREPCSAIFLVGGFSENRYLQKRVKQEFQHRVNTITVPNQPIAAIVRGAALYGLSLKNCSISDKIITCKEPVISTRILNFTYGIKILSRWKEDHPPNRKVFKDRIHLFETFVKRGTEVKVKDLFTSKGYKTLNSNSNFLTFELYKTKEYSAKYHDEPGMSLVGKLRIFLPNADNSSITFGFSFGGEITAFAKNELTGQNFEIKFELFQDP